MGPSRGCDECGAGIRTADASYGEGGEILCDGCAARQQARRADAIAAAALVDAGHRPGLSGWQLFRLGLIGLKLVVLLGYLIAR